MWQLPYVITQPRILLASRAKMIRVPVHAPVAANLILLIGAPSTWKVILSINPAIVAVAAPNGETSMTQPAAS